MKQLLWTAAVLAAVLAGHTMSADDEAREAALYCAMVADGTWPNYAGRSCPANNEGK